MNISTIPAPDEYQLISDAWELAINFCKENLENQAIVFLPADREGWVNTEIIVSEGQKITLLSHGQVWLSREAGLALGPNVTLWYRIGDGLIARSPASSITFRAKEKGLLYLIVKPPGEWASQNGDFLPEHSHVGAEGGVLVAALVWSGDVDKGLGSFAANDETGIAKAELERQNNEKPVPKGWAPLWRLGETKMFAEETNDKGASLIACHCNNDAGILTYPVDIPFDKTVRLDWSWCVSTLPSRLAEDRLETHDYLSVAVEFDNGQDVSYLWSSCLPVDYAFRCPIPFWWDKHETHIVCRSGYNDLGVWVEESRNIFEDYRGSIDFDLPNRIVAIWLLGITPFQRTLGECMFRNIHLKSGAESVWIGP